MISGVPTDITQLEDLLRKGEGPTLEFKRSTGAVEIWGRGTNRVIAECERHGITPPSFEERQGFVIVTFKAPIAVPAGGHQRLESELGSQLELELESLEHRVWAVLRQQALGKGPLARALGQKQASGPLHEAIRSLLAKGLIERTIPDKPGSRLQRYRITLAGEQGIKKK